ncbi:hypothetical protein COB64_00450 [Candidatus Wolfebacteria bacterium]|nr:MAG: hypothetical protein COB64_00450 [Candidatus Wolfebacteria bacterium]
MRYFKILLSFIFILGLVPVHYIAAAALSFSPSSIEVHQEETFTVDVILNSAGVKNYTTKVEILYPADLVRIQFFSFGPNWIPLSQSGFDLVDNVNGRLIKTAGYPGGTPLAPLFGTITFSSKNEGSDLIKVSDNSLSLSARNKNILSGTSSIPVVVTSSLSPEALQTHLINVAITESPSREIATQIPIGYRFETDLEFNDHNADVAYLQICLQSSGHYSGSIDGNFGTSTKEAVTLFQEKYFEEILDPSGFSRGTGFVGEATQSKLNEECSIEQTETEEIIIDAVDELPEALFDIQIEPTESDSQDKRNVIPVFIILGLILIALVYGLYLRNKR